MAEAPDNHTASPSFLLTWGRLLRLPNLFTVPGDPIAGYLLASGGLLGWNVLGAVAASMCIYCGGLLLNDYFDRKVDARERPERPIPSGAVQPKTVLAIGGLLLVVGPTIACAAGSSVAGVIAAFTALAVYAYDARLKKVRCVGPIVMGSCRAGSVLIGAAFGGDAFGQVDVLTVVGIVLAYTTSVTVLAAGEARGSRVGPGAFVPALVLALGGAIVVCLSPFDLGEGMTWRWDNFMIYRPFWELGVLGLILLAFATCNATVVAYRARRGMIPTPVLIGRLIRVMVTTQAAWCLWAAKGQPMGSQGIIHLLVLFVALGLAANLTSRRFYGS